MVELDNPFGPNQPCFACSPAHPIGFRLRFRIEGEAKDRVATTFCPGEQYQGPPGILHGGLVTVLADEVAAWAIIALKGKFGFTASMQARLRGPVRIGQDVIGRSWITEDARRLVKVHVELEQAGVIAYEGDFSFVLVDRAGAEKLLGGPIPADWEQFLR